LHPIALLQILFAKVIGQNFQLTDATFWAQGFFSDREPYLLSIYAGIVPLLLSLVAIAFSRRRWISYPLLGISVITVILALGKYTPLYHWLFQVCPLFRYGRYPVKYLLAANFCLCLLVGVGWDRMEEFKRAWQQRPAVRSIGMQVFVVFVALLWVTSAVFSVGAAQDWLGVKTGLSWSYQGQSFQISPPIVDACLRHSQLMLGAFLICLGLLRWKKIRIGIVRGTIVCVLFLDLAINNLEINPLIPVEFYRPAPASLYLQEQMKQSGLARIFSDQSEAARQSFDILGKSDNVAWKSLFSKLILFQFLSAKEHIYHSVFAEIDKLEIGTAPLILKEILKCQTIEEQINLMAGLNIRYLLTLRELDSPLLVLEKTFEVNATRPLRIYRLIWQMPRAFLAAASGSVVSEFSLKNDLAVGRDIAGDDSGDANAAGAACNSPVRVIRYTPNRVELEANSAGPCLLLLLDSYYPGWKALIDGQETKISAANSVFRAINFPAGNHHVTFQYDPKSFRYGLWITLVTLCIWGFLFIFRSRLDRFLTRATCDSLHRLS
jgi:Bacterial membrane protein YfhO